MIHSAVEAEVQAAVRPGQGGHIRCLGAGDGARRDNHAAHRLRLPRIRLRLVRLLRLPEPGGHTAEAHGLSISLRHQQGGGRA
ncbi:YlbF family regulator, partial [Dysosmobacter welbionis]